jgi:SHS family lactate transporter-like MFS transporter
VQGAWGVIPAHITELSPDSVRGFLPGFAYQCGVLVASSVVYLEALFAARTSYAQSMALTAVTVFTLAVVVAGLGREKRGVEFGADKLGERGMGEREMGERGFGEREKGTAAT